MTIDDLAICIGAYAFIDSNASFRGSADDAINRGLVVLDQPDEFPAIGPEEPRLSYATKAKELLIAQAELMSEKERLEFATTYKWPDVLTEIVNAMPSSS